MLCLAILFLSAAQFFFLLFLLKHFAWDAISSMMQKREEKIANDLDSAEQSRLNAAKLEKRTPRKIGQFPIQKLRRSSKAPKTAEN